MSERWPGGIVRSTPVTPTGPLQNGTAPGIWTMEQAAYWTKQGLWPTAGNFLAVEDVFSTWLYTGNGSTQTITNGINLSGQGGLVWIKDRNNTGDPKNHYLYDTVRGTSVSLSSNTTSGNLSTSGIQLTAFNNNGFSLGSSSNVNQNTFAHVAWTFREAANFFDVVTGTADGSGGFSFSHNLGSTPGMVILKNTNSGAGDWLVFHTSTGTSKILYLNQTSAAANIGSPWINVSSTSVSSNGSGWFVGGATYVAYLFAHDTSSTGIIQCGSATVGGDGIISATLGWEPQWVLVKASNSTGVSDSGGGWWIQDNMRGLFATSLGQRLQAQSSNAEDAFGYIRATSTGFSSNPSFAGSSQYIYVAIRRGPMRTPTLGTSVFTPIAWSGTGSATSVTGTSYPVDMAFVKARNTNSNGPIIVDRLRSVTNTLYSPYNQSESANSYVTGSDIMNGLKVGTDLDTNMSGVTYVYEMFRRAPGFMDEVCYTGNASNRTINHNLGVTPELMIIKSRSAGGTSTYDWVVYAAPTWGTGGGTNNLLKLNSTISASFSNDMLNNTQPTSSVFSLGFYNNVNANGTTYVAYLFASCPGVSKVGSYTGNGTSQTINCGFTTGARFFLVKRTDSAGNWFVWDSARGIVAGNDPYYAMNDTNGDNYLGAGDIVDADNSGIIVNQESTCNINVNAATYIYLAIS